MIERMLQIVAPHHCYGCDKIGSTLCDNCKYNIIDDPFLGCIVCRKATSSHGVCDGCRTSFERAWIVTERTDDVQDTLDGYKFGRQMASARVFAELLDKRLPDFHQMNVTIVPIPTISPHIRQRGYDHMSLIAKELARRRKLPYSTILARKTNAVQLGSSRLERLANAKDAYGLKYRPNPETTYLLIDDVVTTGATLQFGAKALRDHGASAVWVAAIARQPLDKAA
jgi:competence protein ComFC